MFIYMYIAPGQGQTTPGVNFFSLTVLFSQYIEDIQMFLLNMAFISSSEVENIYIS